MKGSSPTKWRPRVRLLAVLVLVTPVAGGADPAPGRRANVAREAQVLASASMGMGFEAESAVDGSLCTLWICDATTAATDGAILTCDLGAARTVTGYTVAHAEAARIDPAGSVMDFQIEAAPSVEGPWTKEFASGDEIAAGTESEFAYETPKPVRFVRLRFRRPGEGTGERVCVAEFEVWTDEAAVSDGTPERARFHDVLDGDAAYQRALAIQKADYYHTDAAQAAFREIIDAATTPPTVKAHALLRLAECEDRASIFTPNDRDGHLVHLERVIREFPGERDAVAEAWWRIGEVHTRSNRWAEGEACLAHAVSHFPDTEGAYWARMTMIDHFSWQGWTQRARLAFEEIEQGFLAGRVLPIQYGWALQKVGHTGMKEGTEPLFLGQEQIAALERAWEVLKDDDEAAEPAAACKCNLAMHYAARKEWSRARAHYEDLYARFQDLSAWSGYALYQIAFCHYMEDNLNRAEELAREVQKRYTDVHIVESADMLIEQIDEKRRYHSARKDEGAKQYPTLMEGGGE